MNYLDEEYLMQQKERLLDTYRCDTIKEVIEILERRIKRKRRSEKKSHLRSSKGT